MSAKLLFVLGIVTGLATASTAFFWGSSAQEPPVQYPQYYYHQRVLGASAGYGVPNTEPPVPSIPVQVPLQAQLAPAAVHNVQLVPCLCPVSQDIDYEKVSPEYYINSQHKVNK